MTLAGDLPDATSCHESRMRSPEIGAPLPRFAPPPPPGAKGVADDNGKRLAIHNGRVTAHGLVGGFSFRPAGDARLHLEWIGTGRHDGDRLWLADAYDSAAVAQYG